MIAPMPEPSVPARVKTRGVGVWRSSVRTKRRPSQAARARRLATEPGASTKRIVDEHNAPVRVDDRDQREVGLLFMVTAVVSVGGPTSRGPTSACEPTKRATNAAAIRRRRGTAIRWMRADRDCCVVRAATRRVAPGNNPRQRSHACEAGDNRFARHHRVESTATASTSYDLKSADDRSPLSPSPGPELPATVRGGSYAAPQRLHVRAGDRAMEGQRLERRGAGSRQLRTAREECKVHSGGVDPHRAT